MSFSGIGGNQFMPNMNQMYGSNNNGYYNPNQMNQLDKYMEQLTNRGNNQPNNVQSFTNMDFIVVESIDVAKNYVVQNGETKWFRHSMNPEIYVKSVNGIGEPSFMGYTLTPIEFREKQVMEQQIDTTKYVPIDTFNELGNKVNMLERKISDYEGIIDRLSQPTQFEEVKTTNQKNVGKPRNSSQKVGE